MDDDDSAHSLAVAAARDIQDAHIVGNSGTKMGDTLDTHPLAERRTLEYRPGRDGQPEIVNYGQETGATASEGGKGSAHGGESEEGNSLERENSIGSVARAIDPETARGAAALPLPGLTMPTPGSGTVDAEVGSRAAEELQAASERIVELNDDARAWVQENVLAPLRNAFGIDTDGKSEARRHGDPEKPGQVPDTHRPGQPSPGGPDDDAARKAVEASIAAEAARNVRKVTKVLQNLRQFEWDDSDSFMSDAAEIGKTDPDAAQQLRDVAEKVPGMGEERRAQEIERIEKYASQEYWVKVLRERRNGGRPDPATQTSLNRKFGPDEQAPELDGSLKLKNVLSRKEYEQWWNKGGRAAHNDRITGDRIGKPSNERGPIWKNLRSGKEDGRKYRYNGESGKDRQYDSWDSEKNELEVFDHRGRHMGAYDPYTGHQKSGPKPGRSMPPDQRVYLDGTESNPVV